MESNTLKAIINIKNLNNYDLDTIYPPESEMVANNRIQAVGARLEAFIKDAYANSFNEVEKINFYSKYFSYLGNANNPPDSMLKDGDAIEVKKLASSGQSIQLNSSFPKDKLHSHDRLITNECRSCENWTEKDMLYTLGIVENKAKMKSLLFVYGDCFAADEEVYLKVKNRLVDSIKSLPDSQETNELGRINNVDPLGITNLRVRGMWILENPYKIFKKFINSNSNNPNFSFASLMKKEKYDSFPNKDKNSILNDEDIILEEVKILNPNNPAKQMDAIVIRFDVP